MLLKNTPIGDLEVNNDDERDARAFVEGLVARCEVALEGEPVGRRTTWKVVRDPNTKVRKLERVRFF